jgi:hypothetical protein
MKVFKYPLPTTRGESIITIHPIVFIAKAAIVRGYPYMWAVVLDDKPIVEATLLSFETGASLDRLKHFQSTKFIDTILLENGDYVLHQWLALTKTTPV